MDHFVSGFSGEGDQKNLFRRDALIHEFGHTMDQGMGFSTAGSRQHQRRDRGCQHDFLLLGIQPCRSCDA